MKTIKEKTAIRLLLDMGYGDRVKHGIVTTVNDQDSIEVRIGHNTPWLARRVGSRQFEAPSGSTSVLITVLGDAAGDVV